MKNNTLLSFLFLLASSLFGEEIEIKLPTQNKDITIYISTCRADKPELASLTNFVIPEDFTVDGRGILISKNEKLLSHELVKGEAFYSSDIWKKNRIDYVLVPVLDKSLLSFHIFSVRKGTIKTLSKVELSPEVDKNVATLHKVSDFLMKELFGSPGISSKRILYSYKPYKSGDLEAHGNWSAEIYETDSLGLTKKRITFENSYSITPSFIAGSDNNDSYEFVYVTYKIGQPQICHGKKGGPCKTSFIKLRGNQLLPQVSYDGKYISFISDASGKSDVFLQKVDSNYHPNGRPMQVYSGRNGTSASPALSPDNSLLAFVNDKSGRAKIYLCNIKDTIAKQKPPTIEMISAPCTECTAPAFSPDGKSITFSGKVNGRRQIWIYDITGKKAYQLTSGVEDKENPSFGSDGRHIVYNTTSPTTDLFLLSIDQKTTRRLTKGSGEKHYPAFEK